MFIRTCAVFTFACLVTASLMATDSPFIGKWKANVGKSHLTGTSYTVEDLGGGSYKTTLGNEIHIYYGDGKEHATQYGSTCTFTSDGPNKWNVVSKLAGKVVARGSLLLSGDGQTLTQTLEIDQPNGKIGKQVLTEKRTTGTSGLAGTWENTNAQMVPAAEMDIQPLEGGLSFVNLAYREHDDVKFDGKNYPDVGPRVAPGSTTSGKMTSERIIDLTSKINGKPVGSYHMKLSEDGKTITAVYISHGGAKPQTTVFERQ